MKDLPVVGREYCCFNGGIIHPSRRYSVEVKEVVPNIDMHDEEVLYAYMQHKNAYTWLFDKITDYFIITTNEFDEKEVFVRTRADNWYSLSTYVSGGLLDIDGELTHKMCRKYKEE